jgi:hypothetical protein
MALAVDTSPLQLRRQHREVLAALHWASVGEDSTAGLARELQTALLAHLGREERLESDLAACLEGPPAPGGPPARLPGGLTRDGVLRRLDILHAEHRGIRHLAERLRESAVKEGHGDVARTVGTLLAHIAVEDGVVFPLVRMRAEACEEASAQGATAPQA